MKQFNYIVHEYTLQFDKKITPKSPVTYVGGVYLVTVSLLVLFEDVPDVFFRGVYVVGMLLITRVWIKYKC